MTSPEKTEPSSDSRGSSYLHRSTQRPAWARRFIRRFRKTLVATGVLFILAILVAVMLRIFAVDVYTVNQDSMYPTLEDGERMLVDKRDSNDIDVGDIVVFDGEGSFVPYRGGPTINRTVEQIGHWLCMGSAPDVFVKRVLGTEGDVVTCCDDQGRLMINGEPYEEPYLYEEVTDDTPASELEFEAEVPQGRIWVMGDHRNASIDSRDLLGAPGGGMISEDRVIGDVSNVVWPWQQRRVVTELEREGGTGRE